MWELKQLIVVANQNMACVNGKWVPARPMNHTCRAFRERVREAWAVYKGKAEAFKWPEGQ
jgi:hypothetical protein